MRKSEIIAAAAASALALCIAAPAAASTTITSGSYTLTDSQFGTQFGVHSNGTQSGSGTIHSHVNQDNSAVTFTSSSLLSANGSGEAKVQGPFSDLDILFAKSWDSVTFNLNTEKKTTPTFTLTVNGSTVFSGCSICTLGNGQNKFIVSGPGITELTFSFSSPIADIRQVRVRGPAGGSGVPEPATWGMMLVGFFGLGAMMRARRQDRALADV